MSIHFLLSLPCAHLLALPAHPAIQWPRSIDCPNTQSPSVPPTYSHTHRIRIIAYLSINSPFCPTKQMFLIFYRIIKYRPELRTQPCRAIVHWLTCMDKWIIRQSQRWAQVTNHLFGGSFDSQCFIIFYCTKTVTGMPTLDMGKDSFSGEGNYIDLQSIKQSHCF